METLKRSIKIGEGKSHDTFIFKYRIKRIQKKAGTLNVEYLTFFLAGSKE
jgi:hypothetical protein